MKILIIKNTDPHKPYYNVLDHHVEKIKKIVPSEEVVIEEQSSKTVEQAILNAEIILLCSNDNYSLRKDQAKKLQWLHSANAGIDYLPTDILTSGILITNSSGVHPVPMAEHTFGFILLFAKHFPHYFTMQKERKWVKDIGNYPPMELLGKTLVVVGLGRIGTRIAELAKAFGMNVIGVVRDPDKPRRFVDQLVSSNNIQAVNKGDFVVNILPFTPETENFFNRKFFGLMKPSGYFINIGRGKSVVEEDLAAALQNRIIAGAAIDVAKEEPLSPESPLWSSDNIIITPHVSSNTSSYMDRVIDIFCENLKAYLAKSPMPNLVDPKRGY